MCLPPPLPPHTRVGARVVTVVPSLSNVVCPHGAQLKKGGLFLGDDYFTGIVPPGGGNFGVRDAVQEFAAARGLRVYSTYEDLCEGRCPNWYLIKC